MRAAITGRRISPPLFESLELLGRASALNRLRAAAAESAGVARAWPKQDRKRPAATPAKSARPARSGNPAIRGQRPGDQPKSATAGPTPRPRGSAGKAAPAAEPVRARIDLQGLLPPDGAQYPHVLRTAQYAWWRSALGVVFGLSMFLLMTTLISQAVVALVWATTAADHLVQGLLRRGVRLPSAGRHAGAEPGDQHADPDLLVVDGDGPPGRAAVAVLGATAAALALPAGSALASRWSPSTRRCCCRSWSPNRCISTCNRASGASSR